MPNQPANIKLYEKVKKMADKRFESKTGVYKSSWIVKEYKRLGGKYKGSKPTEKTGLKRWYKEEWVDLNRPIKKNGKTIGYQECGRKSILKKPGTKYPLCRPVKRVTFATPKTVSEISDKSIMRANREKQKLRESGNIKFGGGKETQDKNKKSRIKSIDEILKEIQSGKIHRERINSNLAKKYFNLKPEKRSEKQMSKQDIQNMKKTIKEILPPKYDWMNGGKAQFYGKRSEIMIKVPETVKRWAKNAFKLSEMGFQGALETGWRRAKQLASQKSIPIEDLRYMRNWYARHIYASYPTFKAWINAGKPNTKEWHRKHGIISWVTWGANAGFNWVNSEKTINLLNNHFNKNYKKIKTLTKK